MVYLQTQSHQAKNYLVLNDTLYRRGVDTILRRCLTFDEAERVLNDCHAGACSGHLLSIDTAQKILRVGYYWPTLFKDCIAAVQKCHPYEIFTKKMRAHPAPFIRLSPLVLSLNGGFTSSLAIPLQKMGTTTLWLRSTILRNGQKPFPLLRPMAKLPLSSCSIR